jgi:hypothetical protein
VLGTEQHPSTQGSAANLPSVAAPCAVLCLVLAGRYICAGARRLVIAPNSLSKVGRNAQDLMLAALSCACCCAGRCIEAGAKRVVVAPYFLSKGRHIQDDIPALVAAAREQFPDVACSIADPIGGCCQPHLRV